MCPPIRRIPSPSNVFALTPALLRNIPRAWQRTRDGDFNVEGFAFL